MQYVVLAMVLVLGAAMAQDYANPMPPVTESGTGPGKNGQKNMPDKEPETAKGALHDQMKHHSNERDIPTVPVNPEGVPDKYGYESPDDAER